MNLTGLLFLSAIAAAFAVLGRRWFARKSQLRRSRALPGAAPARPISVQRYDVIDQTMGARRCACGGRLQTRGEGEAVGVTYPSRFVRAECASCGDEQAVYFDVSGVLH